MSATVVPSAAVLPPPARAGVLERAGRRLVEAALERFTVGRVEISDGSSRIAGGPGSGGATVGVRVHSPAFYSAVAFRGSLGAGEAYMDGLWECDDLPGLIELLVVNDEARRGLESPIARLLTPMAGFAHWLRRNTRAGSRRNIGAHYDLGDEFFALFLDPSMTYSCAVFDRPGMTLAEAQREKIDRACRKLDLRPSDHLLEIGTGWGALALHAAREYGCRVTTTTISNRQFERASALAAEAGLDGRIEVVRRDYRDLTGRYDKCVSIEMIEAVGAERLDDYFRVCSSLLRPEGMMLLQAIVIRDQRYAAASRNVDFLKKHIFPGSCLPSTAAIMGSVRRATDFNLFHHEDIGPHYVATLRRWRASLHERRAEVMGMGLPDTFFRMWDFYLAYCEGVFRARRTGDVQMLLTKPMCRREPYSEARVGAVEHSR